jgi:hypothetical protein
MKIWAVFVVLIPVVLCFTSCEQHPVSDLQKVDPAAAASPTP